MTRQPHVVVVGAGVAGLAAARELRKYGCAVTVLEKAGAVGGRVRTEVVDGFRIDTGAGFIANFFTNTLQFISELGIAGSLVSLKGNGAVLRNGHLAQLGPGLGSISLGSKLRLGLAGTLLVRHWKDLDIHAIEKASSMDTRSAEEYCRSNLTDELLTGIIEPVLAGTFYWTPEKTSQAMLFILLRYWLSMHQFTLKLGMGQLTQAMAADLDVTCNAEVRAISKASNGGYQVVATLGSDETAFRADGVVCAVEAPFVPTIVTDLAGDQREFFGSIQYSSTAISAIAVKGRPLGAYHHILFPRAEQQTPNIVSATSLASKNPNQVPTGQDLIRLYAKGTAAKSLLSQADASIQAALLSDINAAGVTTETIKEPIFSRVYRWQYALPELSVGYFRMLRKMTIKDLGREALVFAGDYIGGPWVEGAITSGISAARQLVSHLGVMTKAA